jgi:cytoskeletal protein CcmA (bactofilin family)
MDIRRIINKAAGHDAGEAGKGTPSSAAGKIVAATPRKAAAPSLISADLRIVGDLSSAGDIHIEGTIEGDIRSQKLLVAEGSQVHGSISADEVRVCGTVVGQIHARRVELTKTARVTGDIVHELLSIESGAHIEGNCRRMDTNHRGSDAVVNLADAVPNPLSAKKNGAA